MGLCSIMRCHSARVHKKRGFFRRKLRMYYAEQSFRERWTIKQRFECCDPKLYESGNYEPYAD